MESANFASVLAAVRGRNRGLVSLYTSSSHHVLSRPVARLLAAAAEQRRDLSPILDALDAGLDRSLAPTPIPEAGNIPEVAPDHSTGDHEARELLIRLRAEEDRDRELFALLATAARPHSPDLAEELLQMADAARKRAATANDHLDLLGMGGA